jgi:FkbM family methyltransferase
VQNVVEFYLSDFIGAPKKDVSAIFIVGGYLGHEIPRLLRANPNAKITVFEPSQRYGSQLTRRFLANPRVQVERCAIADREGEMEFHETSLRGSGSLLPLGKLAMESYRARPAEKFMVPCITLDAYAKGASLDCLWIDVQGAELLVLKGAERLLPNVRSIFVEVSIRPELYRGSATFAEIDSLLRGFGFQLALLGLDKAVLTGNAFYIRTH